MEWCSEELKEGIYLHSKEKVGVSGWNDLRFDGWTEVSKLCSGG